MSKYGNLYKRAFWVDQEHCVYCARTRQCLDHVPAISLLDGIDVSEYIAKGGKLLLFPSCSECNSILHAKDHVYLYDRLNYLLERYTKRLNKIEVWSDEELKEMGKNMRSFIQAQMARLNELNKVVYEIDSKMLKLASGELDEDGMKL